MSILTDLIEGKITFHQAATETEQWGQNLVAHDPRLTSAAGAIVSDVKQAASAAEALAGTYVGQAVLPLAKTVETGLESALAGVTRGASIPFNGFISDGIDSMANAIKAEADAWALKAKSSLVPAAPPGAGA